MRCLHMDKHNLIWHSVEKIVPFLASDGQGAPPRTREPYPVIHIHRDQQIDYFGKVTASIHRFWPRSDTVSPARRPEAVTVILCILGIYLSFLHDANCTFYSPLLACFTEI